MRFSKPLLLIGNGPVGASALLLAQPFARAVVAADGGANTADKFGLVLDAVIGDLDSVTEENLLKNGGKITRVSEQDTTDFEKCLSRLDAPMILGLGFLGGRLDHELAALNALAKYPAQKTVLIGEYDLVFCCPARLELSLPVGTRVSVFPMGRVSGLGSRGLHYPLDGLEMAQDASIGTSNITSVDRQHISVAQGPLLVILPRRHLAAVIVGLTASSDT